MAKVAGGTPREIEKRLRVRVVGQDGAVAALAREAHALLQGRALEKGARRLLLVGDVGMGKRHLLDALGEACNLPVATCAAIQLGEGDALAKIASEVLERTRHVPGSAPSAGIVHLQGLDSASANLTVREALFALLRGRDVKVVRDGRTITFDSRRLLFVASAGLPDLARTIALRTGAGTGYFAQPRGAEAEAGRGAGATEADLVACGLDHVLLDYFPKFEVLKPLGRRELLRVLKDVSGGPLERLREELGALGIDLEVGKGALERLVARCTSEGTERLERELDALFTQVRHDGPELPSSGVGVVRLVRSGSHGLRVVRLRKPSRIQLPLPRAASAAPRLPTLPERPPRAVVNTYGSDRWATLEDLAPFLEQAPEHGVWLQGDLIVERGRNPATLELVRGRGVCLADDPRNAQFDIRRKNVLAVGKVGSGKTAKFVLPLLRQDIADPSRSLVVIDAQGELTRFVYGWARKFRGPNARIVYFNPKDVARSAAWNPLEYVRTKTEIRDFALTLASASPRGERDSPYFAQQASTLLGFVLVALRRVEANPSLGQVRQLLQTGFGALRELATRAKHRELSSWLEQGASNPNMGTSWSELDNMLECWSDDDVCATTERTEFDFKTLDEQPTILVFATPEQYGHAKLAGLRALFIHEYFRFLMQRGEKGDATELATIPLYIDEFASAVGRLHDLHTRCNTLRKRGLAIVAAVQYLEQIEALYGRDGAKAVLAAMGTKVYLPPLHDTDSAFASSLSGTMTVETVTANASGAVASVDLVEAPVMTPGDVRSVPSDPQFGCRATISLPSSPWFQMYLRPWFDNAEDREWFDRSRAAVGGDAIQPPLREKPLALRAAPTSASGLPPRQLDISSTSNSSPQQIMIRLGELREAIGLENASAAVVRWWQEFEKRHDRRHLIAVVEELLRHEGSVDTLYQNLRSSACRDAIAALLEIERQQRVRFVFAQGIEPEDARRHGRVDFPSTREWEWTRPQAAKASSPKVDPEQLLSQLEERVQRIKERRANGGDIDTGDGAASQDRGAVQDGAQPAAEDAGASAEKQRETEAKRESAPRSKNGGKPKDGPPKSQLPPPRRKGPSRRPLESEEGGDVPF